ncbi:hypothetical protein [Alienimonas sp. DA493]|uniref:hypothetical protein n=1 Tax=Alienimonas sp. DA493 TaxID=3373605 RepID=UPI003754D993
MTDISPPADDDRSAPRWTWSLWTTLGGAGGLTAPLMAVVTVLTIANGVPLSGLIPPPDLFVLAALIGSAVGGFGAARALAERNRREESWPLWTCEFGGAFLAGVATMVVAFGLFALIAWMILSGAD